MDSEGRIMRMEEVALICRVPSNTVLKWLKSGKLPEYKMRKSAKDQGPFISGHGLTTFLRRCGRPLGELEDRMTSKILLVCSDLATHTNLNAVIDQDHFKIMVAASGFEAGIQLESIRPDCLLLDFGMGRDAAVMIALSLWKNPFYDNIVVIGLIGDIDAKSDFDSNMFTKIFRKPFDVSMLAQDIKMLVERRKQTA